MSLDSPRRVVITGFGLISPLGITPEALWEGLSAGRSGIAPLESLAAEAFPSSFGGEARDFHGHIDDFGELEKTTKRTIKKGLKVMCREIEMGVAAAQRALAHAGLVKGDFDPERTGTVYGSDHIMTVPEEFTEGIAACLDEQGKFDFSRWGKEGLPKVTPLWLLKYLPNMPASHIAIYNDLRGPSNSITLREASANLAIGEARCTIARGAADRMIAGATGTRIHSVRTIHVCLQEEVAKNGIAPEKASRPFDLDRTGLVLGEGAGAVVLEELETAKARGATIYGEVVGYGSSTVRDHDGTPHFDTAIKNALTQSLHIAGMSPDQIGHVHAHGLSTKQCDAEEARAINDVFDRRKVPVVAAKSNFGNLGAGSGVVELIASTMALNEGRLFSTLNYETPDPECDIAVVQNGDVSPGDSFLTANVSPQAQAAAILVRKYE